MRPVIQGRSAAVLVLLACVLSGGYFSVIRDFRANGTRGRTVRAGRLDVEQGIDHAGGRETMPGGWSAGTAGSPSRFAVSPHPPGQFGDPESLLVLLSVLPLFVFLFDSGQGVWRVSSYETLRLPADHPFAWAKRPPPNL